MINGTQRQAERRSVRTISTLNGHYFYKSPIALMDNGQGLDTVKVDVCTFCSNISACFWSESLTNGEFRNAGDVENVLLCYCDQLHEWLGMVLPKYKVSEEATHSCSHVRDSSRDVAHTNASTYTFVILLLCWCSSRSNGSKSASH